jgi:6-pyruvoyltetrahydropterin/6-carboxytetrahydropterin synthase
MKAHKGEIMILKLHTEVVIDIAHHLDGYEGNCKNVHGHTSKIEIWVKGSWQDKVGIMFDFGKVKDLKDLLDHKDLNQMDYFRLSEKNPTAENIVQFIFNWLKINPYYWLQCYADYIQCDKVISDTLLDDDEDLEKIND